MSECRNEKISMKKTGTEGWDNGIY
jgi:hypothetical protein